MDPVVSMNGWGQKTECQPLYFPSANYDEGHLDVTMAREYNDDHAGVDCVVGEEDGHLLRGEVSGLTRDVPVARQIPVRRVLYV